MRAEAPKSARTDVEGRSSPIVSPSPPSHSANDSSYLPNTNGVVSPANRNRTSSFSYSSILTSSPSTYSTAADGPSNGLAPHHDRPFKYTREEMLNVWKTNAAKFKASGIPLEFEKHEAVT